MSLSQKMINDYFGVGTVKTPKDNNNETSLNSATISGGRMLEDTLNDLGDKRALTGGNQTVPQMKRSVYPYNLF
jgi:hypothetical protein